MHSAFYKGIDEWYFSLIGTSGQKHYLDKTPKTIELRTIHIFYNIYIYVYIYAMNHIFARAPTNTTLTKSCPRTCFSCD